MQTKIAEQKVAISDLELQIQSENAKQQKKYDEVIAAVSKWDETVIAQVTAIDSGRITAIEKEGNAVKDAIVGGMESVMNKLLTSLKGFMENAGIDTTGITNMLNSTTGTMNQIQGVLSGLDTTSQQLGEYTKGELEKVQTFVDDMKGGIDAQTTTIGEKIDETNRLLEELKGQGPTNHKGWENGTIGNWVYQTGQVFGFGSGGILPSYAGGGIFDGPSHRNGGIQVINKKTQKSVAEVEGGEAIIPTRIVRKPGFMKWFQELLQTNNIEKFPSVNTYARGGLLSSPSFDSSNYSSGGDSTNTFVTNNNQSISITIDQNGEFSTFQVENGSEDVIVDAITSTLQDRGLGQVFGSEVFDDIRTIADGNNTYTMHSWN